MESVVLVGAEELVAKRGAGSRPPAAAEGVPGTDRIAAARAQANSGIHEGTGKCSHLVTPSLLCPHIHLSVATPAQ